MISIMKNLKVNNLFDLLENIDIKKIWRFNRLISYHYYKTFIIWNVNAKMNLIQFIRITYFIDLVYLSFEILFFVRIIIMRHLKLNLS